MIATRLGAVLADYDALLVPAMAIPALAAGVDYTEEPIAIDGVPYDAMRNVCLTEVFNPAGRCPVLTVPAGRDLEGVPIGVQVVGRTYDDPTVFRIGAAIEQAQPWPLVATL